MKSATASHALPHALPQVPATAKERRYSRNTKTPSSLRKRCEPSRSTDPPDGLPHQTPDGSRTEVRSHCDTVPMSCRKPTAGPPLPKVEKLATAGRCSQEASRRRPEAAANSGRAVHRKPLPTAKKRQATGRCQGRLAVHQRPPQPAAAATRGRSRLPHIPGGASVAARPPGAAAVAQVGVGAAKGWPASRGEDQSGSVGP